MHGISSLGSIVSLTDEMEQVPVMIDGPVIEISFEVVLPWVIENKVQV